MCDVAESCDGTGTACPTDQFAPATTVCNTTYYCSGTFGTCPTTCTSQAHCVDPNTCSASNTCVLAKRVFVTSTTYTGNMGGLAGADAACNARAQAAGLPGTYVAWLSTTGAGGVNAIDRLGTWPGAYALLDGFRVAGSRAQLTGSIDSAIYRTEFNVQRPLTTPQREVFTGTDSTGRGEVGFTCGNWLQSGTTLSAVVGDHLSASSQWTLDSTSGSCALARPIYCFEL